MQSGQNSGLPSVAPVTLNQPSLNCRVSSVISNSHFLLSVSPLSLAAQPTLAATFLSDRQKCWWWERERYHMPSCETGLLVFSQPHIFHLKIFSGTYLIKKLQLGAPGWRSRLSPRLQPGHDLAVCEFEPRIRLWADGSEPGACFRFCVSLSLCPSLVHALSLSVPKINKK